METSIFLAKLFGVAYIVMGLSMMINQADFKKILEELLKSKSIIFLFGILALVAGFSMVYVHNIWNSSWQVLITILAWAAFLKGLSLLLIPNLLIKFSEKMFKCEKFIMTISIPVLIFGLVLAYLGFYS